MLRVGKAMCGGAMSSLPRGKYVFYTIGEEYNSDSAIKRGGRLRYLEKNGASPGCDMEEADVLCVKMEELDDLMDGMNRALRHAMEERIRASLVYWSPDKAPDDEMKLENVRFMIGPIFTGLEEEILSSVAEIMDPVQSSCVEIG